MILVLVELTLSSLYDILRLCIRVLSFTSGIGIGCMANILKKAILASRLQSYVIAITALSTSVWLCLISPVDTASTHPKISRSGESRTQIGLNTLERKENHYPLKLKGNCHLFGVVAGALIGKVV